MENKLKETDYELETGSQVALGKLKEFILTHEGGGIHRRICYM